MVVLRSDLTNRMGYESRQWHLASPNLEPAAAEWLLDQKPKALVLETPGRLSNTATRSFSLAVPWVKVAYICPNRIVIPLALVRWSCTFTSLMLVSPVFSHTNVLTYIP